MNWHTDTVTADALERLLAIIRASAGTIIRCTPDHGQVQVTWTAQS
ncbi:hypothetical protein [Nocardioides immobilis]|nr:hypothetical protein [Nocardioides immobilis]